MSFCLRIFKVSSFGSGSGSKQMESCEIRFGRFRLDLRRRTLLRDDQPVRLGGRPLGILCALASAGGDVLTEDEVMARLAYLHGVEDAVFQQAGPISFFTRLHSAPWPSQLNNCGSPDIDSTSGS